MECNLVRNHTRDFKIEIKYLNTVFGLILFVFKIDKWLQGMFEELFLLSISLDFPIPNRLKRLSPKLKVCRTFKAEQEQIEPWNLQLKISLGGKTAVTDQINQMCWLFSQMVIRMKEASHSAKLSHRWMWVIVSKLSYSSFFDWCFCCNSIS